MPNFFFWNLNGKHLEGLVAQAAATFDVDILLLAENEIATSTLRRALASLGSTYLEVRNLCPRVKIFVKFASEYIRPIEEGPRYSISKLSLPARKEILLATAHLPSKREFSAFSQAQECARLARSIASAEELVGHKRTLFIGDINVNPFEDGVVGASALHAVMTRDTAAKNSRMVQGEEYSFFYNPMWGHFGDRSGGRPRGTYYYEKAEHVVFFWNIFDQVLLRPALAAGFRDEDLSIVSHIGSTTLVDGDGKPDSRNASDHLPLLLRLEF